MDGKQQVKNGGFRRKHYHTRRIFHKKNGSREEELARYPNRQESTFRLKGESRLRSLL